MASEKLTALPNLAGGQVPTDLTYVVDVSAGAAGSSRSTLNDLFSEITKNITDGAVRFAGFAAPAVSAAGKGALYFSSADNTFKGSRNAGAYENLLFGSGGNTRVAVWNTGADQLTGYAEFVYQPSGSGVGNRVARLTVSGSGQDAQFYTDNTFASTPSSAGLTNLGALNLTRLTTGSFPIITMNQGRSGPAYPQSLDVLGVLRWRSTNNSVFNEAGYIQIVASENHTSLASGSGMEIWSTRPGNATATRRMIIGAGPIGQTIVFDGDPANNVTTNFGTNTRIAVGPPTTNDNNVRVIVSGSAGSSLKNLVLQAGSGQSANIFEAQSSAGTVLYSISAAGAVSFGGAQVITVSSANAFAVGPNGVTNSTFNVVTNVPSAATGLSVTGNAAGSGVTLTTLSSAINEGITYSVKGASFHTFLWDVASANNNWQINSVGSFSGSSNAGGIKFQFVVASASASLRLASDTPLQWNSTGNLSSGAIDTTLRRAAAANIAFGAADAAAPVAQTLSVQNVVAGTSNTAGTAFTVDGSRGTGNAAGGNILFRTAPLGSSGTSQNALVNTLILDASASFAIVQIPSTAIFRIQASSDNFYFGNTDGGYALTLQSASTTGLGAAFRHGTTYGWKTYNFFTAGTDRGYYFTSAATFTGNMSTDSIQAGLVLPAASGVVRLQGASTTTAATFSSPARTPAQITSDQNNYAPGVGWFQRWSSDASRNITGLAAGIDGQVIEIWNVGANNIVLQNENASSTATNRFATSTGADLTLSAGKCAQARYDSTSSRWRVYLCN